ncbi:MAG: UDP-N-acetylglucosamine pyrophosphorylase [Verrucomicrobiota bacterium]
MAITAPLSPKVEALLKRGVMMPCAASVEVDDAVNVQRIASGVIIHTGCKILGAKTSIGPGSEIGSEAPATVEDCQLGRQVVLKGGYFTGTTFLDGSNMGSAAHVRPGTLLEEEANGAHAVGLKQTIFFPFVTAGSLINFCDALMAGGTSRKNHSEIGSSYIHFNFTPHQDKATASLIGDVPRGVMLDQAPVFLGGQGGLVGPVRIGYGSVIPAGIIYREDAPEGGMLLYPTPKEGKTRPYQLGAYRQIGRIVKNNLIYIGNIRALQVWYRFVRKRLMTRDEFSSATYDGALTQIEAVLEERVKRLKELADKMSHSLSIARAEWKSELPPWCAEQEKLMKQWPVLEARLKAGPPDTTGAASRDVFLKAWEEIDVKTSYTKAVAMLAPDGRQAGTAWLQTVVDATSALWGR